MAADLLLAPVGAGKTEQSLARIASVLDQKPFARVWVLLATERQITEFRSRLIEHTTERYVVFNVEFFTFYDLYQRILEAAGQPTRQLGEAARLRLLRVLAKRMAHMGDLDVYEQIAQKSGFIRILADFIYELKQGVVEPARFDEITGVVLGSREKDAELAALYSAYQERLRAHDIVDREGQGWLALAQLTEDPQLHRDVDLVVVDGYDQFTPLQAQIIALMSRRVGQTLVTLTTVPGRDETVGRRFVNARAALQTAYDKYTLPLNITELDQQVEQRHPDMQHLAANIFRLDRQTVPSSGGIAFLAVPDVVTETAAVLRRVKALLLGDSDTRPDDVLIVLRDYERYHVHLRNIGRAYGLPLSLHLGEPLSQTPPIRALMALISLHDTTANIADFLRRPLLDALRSPYFQIDGLGSSAVEMLDRISRELAVVGGREMWLDALETAAKPQAVDEEGDDAASSGKPPLLDEDTYTRLRAALTRFFDAVTPPPHATVTEYVQWLEGLIGHDPVPNPDDIDPAERPHGGLGMIRCARRKAPAYIITRDLAALDAFKKVLQTLLGAQQLLSTLENTGERVPWGEFLADLGASVERESIEGNPPRTGRVLVTTATDARGLPHKHVFIMGLSEGLFPLRQPEDPLYLDNERRRLMEAGLPVRTLAERSADDGLFYELISQVQQTLTLSRPTTKDGAPWIESHLWRESAAVFSDAADRIREAEIRLGDIVDVTTAATPEEAALAVAAGLTKPDISPEETEAYNWLVAHSNGNWGSIRDARTVEANRLAPAKHDRYTGRIDDAALVDKLKTTILSPKHLWSASQLNDYGACPFRFFAGRVLHLEAMQEPQLGMQARQLGSLNHTILEETYRTLAAEDVLITPEKLDFALDVLNTVSTRVLDNAPQAFGFREGPVWEQEKDVLATRLRALVRYDFTDMNEHLAKQYGARPRKPYQTETPFGIGGYGALIDTDTGIPPVNIAGYIDRIDRYGDDALVLDYKTGGTGIKLEELQIGRNFQMMLYVVAAQGILDSRRGNEPGAPENVVGGFFWHIRTRKTSGLLITDDPEHAALIQSARRLIGTFIQRAQAGDFTVHPTKPAPNGRCVFYCEFHKLCRVSVTDPNKPGMPL